jgi:hypothetical protein
MSFTEACVLANIDIQTEKLVQDIFGVLFYATIGPSDNTVAVGHFMLGMKVLIKSRRDAKLALAQLEKEGLFNDQPKPGS